MTLPARKNNYAVEIKSENAKIGKTVLNTKQYVIITPL